MEELGIYLLKSALCTSLFLGIYWYFLRKETFYKFNRHFLLAGLICALILPFYNYHYTVNLVIPEPLPTAAKSKASINTEDTTTPTWIVLLLLLYLVVFFVILIRQIRVLLGMNKVITEQGYTSENGYRMVYNSVFKSCFSVGNYIFMDLSPGTSAVERKLIIDHELAHVQQQHWVDLLGVQLICALQWFNPFAWLYLRVIKQNHEFLADTAVLSKGTSAAVYRATLINHSLRTPVFDLASSFATVDNLERIKMMTSPPSKPLRKLGALMIFPAISLFLFAFAQPKYQVKYTEKQVVPSMDSKRQTPAPQHISTEAKKNHPLEKSISRQSTTLSNKFSPEALTAKTKIPKKTARIIAQHHSATPQADSSTMELKVLTISNTDPSGSKSADPKVAPSLMLLNGVPIASFDHIKATDIQSIEVFKGDQAIQKYGARGKNGVISITLKTPL